MVESECPGARIPISTYRLQFDHRFKFSDAKRIIPYLFQLGISDVYASPYLKAREGSLHGYDIVDYHRLNPEVGTEEEYEDFVCELHRYGMGQILDIVPNHMCITSKENRWWMDLLENGPSSLYASFFDIDWNPAKKELQNKILLPILGDQYGTVLEKGELRLTFHEGAFYIHYKDHQLPVRPKTWTEILGDRLKELEKSLGKDNPAFAELLSIITALNHLPDYTEKDPEKIKERHREKEIIKRRLWNLYRQAPAIRAFIDDNVTLFNGREGDSESFNLLDRLLTGQIYRLSFWRVAAEEINYRRFFDINELAAVRAEDPRVFYETHSLVFKLVREGKATGLRVDHPDGLYNPSEYFKRLQQSCAELLRQGRKGGGDGGELSPLEPKHKASPSGSWEKPFYIVGEKILVRGERMPEDWPIYSTTGYVFLNSLNGVFVRMDHARLFDRIYARFTKIRANFQEIVYEKKKLIMLLAMSSEINTLGRYLDRISEKSRHTRDFTLNSLMSAIVEVIAFFPVYRTYINASGATDRDQKYIESAVSKAKRKNPAISESIFDFLKDVLLLNHPENLGEDDRSGRLDFVMRFQQATGPVMAKGVEDTACYVYNRLVSLNEVGGSPDRFGTPLETFHGQNIERNKFWPHALIATSTHDSKRSEDVRARINVLSEIPDEWKDRLIRWHRLNKKKKPVVEGMTLPEPNEEYFLYQALIGAWPVEPVQDSDYEAFKKRIQDYMIKAAREAKVHTSWINPNRPYEDALTVFVERVMTPLSGNPFLHDFRPFQREISHFGMLNSLSQTLLKITSPGVPDFYQGTEIWDFSLVDPDNRRPVDYRLRERTLEALKRRESEGPLSEMARELVLHKDDGRVKLYLTYKTLNYRRENRALFEQGEYLPLEVRGARADHLCAFARRTADAEVVIVAPRFLTALVPRPDGLPVGSDVWKDAEILIPTAHPETSFRNLFTGETRVALSRKGGTVLSVCEILDNFPVALLVRGQGLQAR